MSAANDVKLGRDSLVYFHNQALKYPQNYNLSFQELINNYPPVFLEGFGFGIASAEMSDRQVRDGMIALADAGEGRLPARQGDFFNALIGPATSVSFTDAAAETLKGTARDVLGGLEEVGNTAITTLKNTSALVTYLPYVAFAALVGYAAMKVKRA